MKAGVDAVEQDAGGILECAEVGPPAVVTEPVREVMPDPLEEVQHRAVRRRAERPDAVLVGGPLTLLCLLPGFGYVISRSTKNRDVAWKVTRWLASEEGGL